MKKSILISIVVILVLVVGAIIFVPSISKKEPKEPETNSETKTTTTNLQPINTAEDLFKLVDKIYEGQENLVPSLATQEVDTKDSEMVKYVTGLENADNLQYVVVSEPMMSSQAYCLILAKVKDGVNANEIAKEMKDKIDPRKWICVTAEKVYATNSGDVVCLVMSSEERAKPIYEKFKSLAGTIGQEYERTETDSSIE